MANRLFGKTGFEYNPDFLETTAEYYQAEMENLDFSGATEEARVHINDWVADQTNQKILNLLKEGTISKATVIVLVNAIYFKGLWTTPFVEDRTREELFHITDDEGVNMDMMSVQGRYRYKVVEELAASFIEIPYVGGEVSMYIILPDEVTGLPHVEEQLTGKLFKRLFKGMKEVAIDLHLPKFEMTQEMNLGKILQDMGITDAFDPSSADLSNIAASNADLVLSEVIHKAFVKVDEEGTEAAAASAGIVNLAAVRNIEFHANRPFIFIIRENPSGSILFMGRYSQGPKELPVIGTFGLLSDKEGSNGAPTMVSSMLLVAFSLISIIFS